MAIDPTENAAREKTTYLLYFSANREKFNKMENDVTIQDEKRTMKLEKEKDSVRVLTLNLYVCYIWT